LAYGRQSLEERVIKIRGDNSEVGKLISEFKPFIAGVAQKRVGKFLQYGVDDELSVGLSAFKEAVDSYDAARGKFLSFARMVISMRLIDHFRKQGREKTESLDGSQSGSALDQGSVERYRISDENEKRILEIIQYRTELEKWGISLEELAEISPIKKSLREQYKMVARIIVNKSSILDTLMKTKRLPIKEIEEVISIHRKKLERGRIYIIAMVLAIIGNLSYIDICRGDKK